MKNVLITGAGRGIGLEFARQYLAEGWAVHACCRDPSQAAELQGLAPQERLRLHRLDVTDAGTVAALAKAMEGETLDLLINNAGIIGQRDAAPGRIDYAAWEEALRTNVLGSMRVSEALTDSLAGGRDPVLAILSSRMGSIGEAGANSVVYRSSKAAVNMVMRCLALTWADRGIRAVALHPGWVRTDMGGASAPVTVQDSATGMRRVIASLDRGKSGGFFNYDGTPIPW